MPLDLTQNLAELETKGFTVIRNLVDTSVTARARQLVDGIIGHTPGPAGSLGVEKVITEGAEARGQPGPWPEPGDERPVISSGGYTHSLHHPICDGKYGQPGLMAELLEPFVDVNKQLLNCDDESAKDLKLMQQFFRRTDFGGDPEVDGATGAGKPPRGWHMDQAFLPRHYDTKPRQMFYHSILALCDVVQDGAPFFGARNSFRNAKAMTELMSAAEQDHVVPAPDMTRTKLGGHLHEMSRARGGELFDPGDYEEVHFNEGDLLILDPMCTHSGSSNGGSIPARYVLFTALFHSSACDTTPGSCGTLAALMGRNACAPAYKFPADLREALPPSMRPLLDWTMPDAVELVGEAAPRPTPQPKL